MTDGSISSLFISFAQMLQSHKERHRKIMLSICKTVRDCIIFFREILQIDILSMASTSLPPSSSSGMGKKIAGAKTRALMMEDKRDSIKEGLRGEKAKQTYNSNYFASSDGKPMPSQTEQLSWKMVIVIVQDITQYGTCLWSVQVSCINSVPQAA